MNIIEAVNKLIKHGYKFSVENNDIICERSFHKGMDKSELENLFYEIQVNKAKAIEYIKDIRTLHIPLWRAEMDIRLLLLFKVIFAYHKSNSGNIAVVVHTKPTYQESAPFYYLEHSNLSLDEMAQCPF